MARSKVGCKRLDQSFGLLWTTVVYQECVYPQIKEGECDRASSPTSPDQRCGSAAN